MMRRFIPLILACCSASAFAYGGKDLLQDCHAAEAVYAEKQAADFQASPAAARCFAYIGGFADGYGVADRLAGQVGVQIGAFCLPTGTDRTYRALRAVLVHLERQPPSQDAALPSLVASAFAKAFPCSQ